MSLLERRKLTPGIIVVGIRDIDGRRDLTPTEIGGGPGPSGGAKTFLRHIAEEIVPFVEKRYSAGPRRLFWGHSIVGAFGIYCGLERPELFEGILVSSPWVIYDGSARYLFEEAPRLLERPCTTRRFFFITCGKEPRLEAPIAELVEILRNPARERVDCRYQLLPDATHDSSMIATLPMGLRAFFER